MLDRLDGIEYGSENKFLHQPGIMLGTLELNLKIKKSKLTGNDHAEPLHHLWR